MDFAKKLMEKYGWSEGKGLGKNESGISQPVKANLKFDNAGIGHKHGEQSNKWWEQLYNECADNVKIKKSSKSEDIVVKLKNKELLNEIKTKKRLQKHKDENIAYGTFMKKSVLTQTGVVKVGEDCSDEETKPVKINVLSDEELFAACGGRTAHKGARHGLNLKGKLARIEEQERKFANMPQKDFVNKSEQSRDSVDSDSSWESLKSNDNSRNRKLKRNLQEQQTNDIDNVFEDIGERENRKRKLVDSIDDEMEKKLGIVHKEGVKEPESNLQKSPRGKHAQNKRRRMGTSTSTEPAAERDLLKTQTKVKVKKLKKRDRDRDNAIE